MDNCIGFLDYVDRTLKQVGWFQFTFKYFFLFLIKRRLVFSCHFEMKNAKTNLSYTYITWSNYYFLYYFQNIQCGWTECIDFYTLRLINFEIASFTNDKHKNYCETTVKHIKLAMSTKKNHFCWWMVLRTQTSRMTFIAKIDRQIDNGSLKLTQKKKRLPFSVT